MYTYLLINIFTLLGPLALSFDKKVAFYKNWRYLFPALGLNGIVFLVWDHFFTVWNVWSFNPQYITGIYFWELPLEEILFFLTVPYACLFIYECVRSYFPKDYLYSSRRYIGLALILICLVIYFIYPDRIYTTTTTLGLAFLLFIVLVSGPANYLGWFFMAYLISIIPFALVNGVLTSFPVVSYNDAENMGIRLGSIPADDLFYNMFMLLLPVSVYERLRKDRS